MTLEQVRNLVLALVTNFSIPADKGELSQDEFGCILGDFRLGHTIVRLSVSVYQEPDGRFVQHVFADTSSELLCNLSALVGLLDAFRGMEDYIAKVLRSIRAPASE